MKEKEKNDVADVAGNTEEQTTQSETTEQRQAAPELETLKETLKQKKPNKQITELERKRDEYKDAWIRERADFENYKKRNAAVTSRAYSDGVADAIEKLLPVADNLERALSVAKDDDPLKIGLEMTLKQFSESIGKLGCKEIDASGGFDPNFHNAIGATDGGESGQIAEVMMKGYKVGDRVIRHSMVRVYN